MNIIPLQQGTPEWLEYRKAHGMASESPALLGSALYHPLTPFQLWLVKKGLSNGHTHPGMRAGLEYEACAREVFAHTYRIERCEPIVVEEDTHLLAASLDGYYEDAEGGGVLEIKHWADSGTIPTRLEEVWPAHYDQVQHQLAVTEARQACLMIGNRQGASFIWIPSDEKRQTAIRAAWGKFWVYMEGEESPPLTERDYDEGVCEDIAFKQLEVSYALLHSEFEAARTRLERTRAMLIAFADGRNVKGRHCSVLQSYRSSIDMAALRADIDIARYKRVPKLVTTVRSIK